MKIPLFTGTAEIAYRDPACIYVDGTFYLFMTISRKSGGYMYNTLGLSESRDLIHWEDHGIAMFPDELGTMYSGSAIEDTEDLLGKRRDGKNA